MAKGELIVPKTWRSEAGLVVMFVVLSVASVILSNKFPGSIIQGKVIGIGSVELWLSLPMFWFLPFIAITTAMVRIYNVRYMIDSRGIEARVGILSLNQSITRIRFEDIRGVETDQSILDRILDIGEVQVSTAATYTVEVVLDGVAAPKEVQDMIQSERDSRTKSRERMMRTEERATA